MKKKRAKATLPTRQLFIWGSFLFFSTVIVFTVIQLAVPTLFSSLKNYVSNRNKEEISQVLPTVSTPTTVLTTEMPTPTITTTDNITPTPSNSVSSPTPKPTSTPTPKATTKPVATPKLTNTITPTPTPIPTFDYSKPWTVSTNCPQTTQLCVPCTSGTTCRFDTEHATTPNKRGFLGWSCQNNNPGNIRNAATNMATDFKNKLISKYGGTPACGVRYDSRGGSYFVFSTYTAGYNALKAYIKAINAGEHSSYSGSGWACGECTLTQFFSKYAPSDASYASFVANEIEEPTSQTLSYIVSNKLTAFADAIKKREGFFVQ